MKVSELIDVLKGMPQDRDVYVIDYDSFDINSPNYFDIKTVEIGKSGDVTIDCDV